MSNHFILAKAQMVRPLDAQVRVTAHRPAAPRGTFLKSLRTFLAHGRWHHAS
ncbi:MAG: hypothetical protein AAF318_18190 [Pseudomonadota bacterium]